MHAAADWCLIVVLVAVALYLKPPQRRRRRSDDVETFLPANRHFVTVDANGNLSTFRMTDVSGIITTKHNQAIAHADRKHAEATRHMDAKRGEVIAHADAKHAEATRQMDNSHLSMVNHINSEITSKCVLKSAEYKLQGKLSNRWYNLSSNGCDSKGGSGDDVKWCDNPVTVRIL